MNGRDELHIMGMGLEISTGLTGDSLAILGGNCLVIVTMTKVGAKIGRFDRDPVSGEWVLSECPPQQKEASQGDKVRR